MSTEFPEGPLTILFTDVEGSTDLRTRRGDAAAHEILRQHEDLVRACVDEHRGREVKALGDGFMVVFASVRRALACAIAIQQAVEEHSWKSPASAVRVRIGLNTGEVVDEGSDLYGQAVNAAARIAARAGAGEILVSEVTRQLAGSGPEFAFLDRGRARLKGFPDRWHLYGLVWEPKDRRGPMGLAAPTPYVGRETELGILGQLLDEARAGTTHFVVIEGEAGMGKSRLLEEIVGHPGAVGFSLQRARAEELQPRPFGLLADALAIDTGSSDPDRLAIAQLLDTGADAAGEAMDHRYRVTEGVINLIERAAIAGPVLVILDDVHWADPSSAQALNVLCRRLAYLPILVVMACRPLPRPPELARLLDALAEIGGRHLRLAPLGGEAVTELAASRLEADPGPILRARLEGAAGNPLFVLELLDALSEEGTIEVEANVAEATSAVEPPPSLRMTVLRRLAFLSPAGLELLRTASLFGGSFSAAQLSLVTGKPLLDVLSTLEEPTASGFVTASGEAFAFRHDVVREALYLELPAPVRKGLHLHVGRALAAAGASPAEVADHLALGAEFGDREAVAWLRRAARELRSRAPAIAVQLLERASSLLPVEDPERASLVREEIRTLAVAGRAREAEALVGSAMAQVTDPVDALKLSGLNLELLADHLFRPREAEDLAGQLLDSPVLPPEVRADLLVVSAAARAELGDVGGALARIAEAGPFTEAHPNSRAATVCLWVRMTIASAQGFWGQAVELAEQAVASAAGSPFRLGQALLYLGVGELLTDRHDEARVTLDRGGTHLERLGDLSRLHEHHWFVAHLHFHAGRWDDALAEMATAWRLTAETGSVGHHAQSGDPSPLIYLHRGDVPAARDALGTIEGDPTPGALTLSGLATEPVRALIDAGAGHSAAALRTLEAWHESALERTFLPDYRVVGRALVRLCRGQGKTELAERMVTEAAEARRRAGDVASVEGTALLLQGMVEEDPEALLAAVDAFRAAPRPFDRAEACAEAAVCLLSRGRDGEGRTLLAEAFDLYAEMGAQRSEAALAQEVRAFGIRRGARGQRQRALSGWSALTATEERIVGLVAQGLTNAEIGDRLYIARGTVATHLRSVFRKLDVSSRAELAAEAARHLA